MKKYMFYFAVLFTLNLVGCSDAEEVAETVDSTPAPTSVVQTDSSTDSADGTALVTELPVTATAAPEKELILPVTENKTGKVLIQTVSKSKTYRYNSYIITSVNGEGIVVDPTEMPAKKVIDINPAAILITHDHPDHTDSVFEREYQVPMIKYERGELSTNDFHIYTVPSAHSGDTISEDGRCVIVVFEVDGLRIAHMGDIGQTFLTDSQLQEIGAIDIAFMQFENSYSDMSLGNAKGFTLIEQLNPKVIIPTHYTDAAIPVLEEKYGAITEFDNILEISPEDLQDKELTVYRILNNYKYN